MKKLLFAISVTGAAFLATSCQRDFLDRLPEDRLSEETFFKNENDLRIFANRFYSLMPVQGHTSDDNSDNFVPRNRNTFLAGTYTVPNTGGGWDWTNERQANYFLNRYQRAEASDAVKQRYAAEVRLVRAYLYWRKVVQFGDVVWLSKDLNEQSPELYAPRNPRKDVMDSVLADLNFAVEHLPVPASAEQDRFNKDIANAMKARICLWEGTYRKYRGLPGATEYLRDAATAALDVINTGNYAIYSTGNPTRDYVNLFLQEELRGNKEAIMARRFVKDVSMHNITRQISDVWPSFSKNFVRSILCADGLPISLSPDYLGDDTPENERANRDPRYTQLIVTRDYVVTQNADGSADKITLPRIPAVVTGYASAKYKSPDPLQWVANQSTLDLFVLRYAETLLIYAEAKAELGEASQGVIDQTINQLRDRVGMPHMNIATLVKDPASDFPALPVLLDEIRRERRIELAQEGFRFDDIIRWKEGRLIANPETILGMKLTPALRAQYPASQVAGIQVDANNYIRVYTDITARTWNEKLYLYPLPLQELTLNPQLAPQNTGW
ncbi:RagB/SusD family nutrient uptake outer membrane protein [Chitinophaga alhagiae]|uniref:RagB/SusD family nutrient uptake outer membrane protein n=1 Tax=Chitinophaga alhagiae TaxID=2203219 RepID=A0ABM6W958_9BACT|nr:RagB/SusD family nutrient uptake outer membrane protein [Chitinophaga alhagiae]AWO00442.1 RagB/SusD family nutrient uptake outer membrane protein [Chitinophaga alhagiae]